MLRDRNHEPVATWDKFHAPTIPLALLAWYGGLLAVLAIGPSDRQNWVLVNILPVAFVAILAATYRQLSLSPASDTIVSPCDPR